MANHDEKPSGQEGVRSILEGTPIPEWRLKATGLVMRVLQVKEGDGLEIWSDNVIPLYCYTTTVLHVFLRF